MGANQQHKTGKFTDERGGGSPITSSHSLDYGQLTIIINASEMRSMTAVSPPSCSSVQPSFYVNPDGTLRPANGN